MHWLTKWLNIMVKVVGAFSMLLITLNLSAQEKSLSLQEVYQLSEQNYPLIRQKGLIKRTENITIQNLVTGYFPQLSFNAQGSYQSDVTSVDIPIPNVKVPTQSKDQYKIVADLSQLIYDGGLIKEQKEIQQLNASVEERQVEVEMYALKNRINRIYFSILYQDELLKQTELLEKDIKIGIDRLQQQVNNGTVLRSNLQVLQVQLLQTEQRAIEIRNTRKGLTDALSLFINRSIAETEQFQTPALETSIDTSISRPELRLYDDQSKVFPAQQRLIAAKNRPKVSAFVQGGYGKPGLNMLSDNFDAFYIAGLRLNWSLGTLYNAKREKNLLDINKQSVNIQKEAFLLNTQTELNQHRAEIKKFSELVLSDQAIIELRSKITEAAKAQLENAVITANEYLREINAEDAVRQALATHKLQLLQAQINYQLTSGNL